MNKLTLALLLLCSCSTAEEIGSCGVACGNNNMLSYKSTPIIIETKTRYSSECLCYRGNGSYVTTKPVVQLPAELEVIPKGKTQ